MKYVFLDVAACLFYDAHHNICGKNAIICLNIVNMIVKPTGVL